jgi:ribonuclease HII
MILAGVLIEKQAEPTLKKQGVTDSKLLTHSVRVNLEKSIKQLALATEIVKSSPEEIDEAVNSKMNLNTLEAIKAAQIINELNPKKEKVKVIVDCPSNNPKAWQEALESHIKNKENLSISCEHKADFNHPSVAAASILAKVEREKEVHKIKNQYGDIGSGYPSDPQTKIFLQKNKSTLESSPIVRKSWATWKKLTGLKQAKLF